MAWAGFPKVSLGDLAGAVNKLQESVKSIEKNFDTALGLDKSAPDVEDATKSAVVTKPAVTSALDGWGWGLKTEPAKSQTTEGVAQGTAVAEPAKEQVSEVPKKAANFRKPPLQKGPSAKEAGVKRPVKPAAASQEVSTGGLVDIGGSKGEKTAPTKPPASVPAETSEQSDRTGTRGGSGKGSKDYPATPAFDTTPAIVSAREGTEGAGVGEETPPRAVVLVEEAGLRVDEKEQPAAEKTPDVDSANTLSAGTVGQGQVVTRETDTADVSTISPETQASVLNGGETFVADGSNTHTDSQEASLGGANADSSNVNAPSTEPVTLARIVEGVRASQPFGHGEGTAQEEDSSAPKIMVADAFPAAATPQFKPHAEADSVVDLEASSDPVSETQETGLSRGLGEVSAEAEHRKESSDEGRASSMGGHIDDARKDLREATSEPEGLHASLHETEESEGAVVSKSVLREEASSGGNREKRVEESADIPISKEEKAGDPKKGEGVSGEASQGKSNNGLGGHLENVGGLDDLGRSDGGRRSGEGGQSDGSERLDGDRQSDGGVHGGMQSDGGRQSDGGGQSDELSRLREELKGMEVALQHAAKQAQTKANELAEMGTVNDNLRAEMEELKRKKADGSDLEALRAEYQHRLGTAERKVYALTKERDMLRRESSRKSDTSTLLKEKDEIIKQVMAEGEELSKKQAAVEGQMRKLRGSIRELEVERDRLTSRLQVEEAKTDSIQTDKAKTERQLADAVERAQAELAAQKESYATALQETKEALAKAEAAADTTRRSELDRKVNEAAEREAELVRQLEEVREQMVRDAQSAAAREDRLRRDVRELEARCQDAEARHSELIARVPDSTRPLLRQIEALQEAAASRAEAWGAVERSLNARVQDAEVAAAGAQERERAAGERLTQAASRMAVMEAQVSMLRAEQAALQRSLEKERARASETRQELLALKEAAAVHEGRAAQLEEEMKEGRAKQKKESQEAAKKRDALEQELAALRSERDKWRAGQAPAVHRHPERNGPAVAESVAEGTSDRRMSRRPSNGSSAGSSMEEGAYLQQSLQGVPFSGAFDGAVPTWVPGARGSVSASLVEQLEALLRQREGELTSYSSRLASLESTRDALAEELVKTTQQTEELAREASVLPSLRAELESLRRRHASALELMGERDEEVEELRADLHDHKTMYRDQIDMLVKQIERQSKLEVR